jgi:exosome complex exonuclease DIS3/RRP44
LEANISNPSGQPFLIIGRENINRAIHGDIVAIQILPESEWRANTETIVEEGTLTKDENPDSEDPEIDNEIEIREQSILKPDPTKQKGVQVTAKVVGIIKRNWRTYFPNTWS